jgi:outer membrane lipoprotein-sorting protein
MKYPLLVLLCLAALLPAAADSLPDPATKGKVPVVPLMQAKIYKQLDLADFTLDGVMRSDKTHKSYPIKLMTKGHTLIYKFTDQPLQLRVQLNPGTFALQRRTSDTGEWSVVPSGDSAKPIFDTDITYGDIALDFMNWEDIEPLGTDTIKTLDAFVYEAKPGPSDHSAFASVRFWVSAQYWAFLRIDGVNAKGQTVKRVEVQDVMTVADRYTVFKEMKVSTMAADKNDIAKSTTFIDISEGKAGSGIK